MAKPLLAVLGLTFAATLAACSATPNAATVGGTAISQAALVSQVQGFEASPLVSGTAASSTSAKSKSTIPTSVAAGIVKSDIVGVLIGRILRRRHIAVTAIDKTLGKAELQASAPNGNLNKQIQPAFESYLIGQAAASLALEASLGKVDLSDAGIKGYYDSHSSSFDQVCLEDALYQSQSDAQAAVTAIGSGSTFDQATANSQQNSGGSSHPDCASLGPLPATLQQAILGTAVGHAGPAVPVSTGSPQAPSAGTSAWAVFEVLSKTPQPYGVKQKLTIAEAMLQGSSAASLQSELTALVKAEALATSISVNPSDGKLAVGDKQQLGFDVTAPAGPPASVLPTTTTTLVPASPNPAG